MKFGKVWKNYVRLFALQWIVTTPLLTPTMFIPDFEDD